MWVLCYRLPFDFRCTVILPINYPFSTTCQFLTSFSLINFYTINIHIPFLHPPFSIYRSKTCCMPFLHPLRSPSLPNQSRLFRSPHFFLPRLRNCTFLPNEPLFLRHPSFLPSSLNSRSPLATRLHQFQLQRPSPWVSIQSDCMLA